MAQKKGAKIVSIVLFTVTVLIFSVLLYNIYVRDAAYDRGFEDGYNDRMNMVETKLTS